MQNILNSTKQALEALDFTEENTQHADIQERLAEIKAAQAKIRERTEAIDQDLRGLRDLKAEDAENSAERLLAGEDVAELTKHASTEANLRDERQSLNATWGDLERRHREVYAGVWPLRIQCTAKAAEAVQPLIDAILAEARERAEGLAECFAAMDAVTATTRSNPRDTTALTDAFKALAPLFHATGGFPAMHIPEAVRDALTPLEGKVTVQGAQISVPQHVRGYAPPIETIAQERPEPGPSKLRSWLAPAWARATETPAFRL